MIPMAHVILRVVPGLRGQAVKRPTFEGGGHVDSLLYHAPESIPAFSNP